MPYFAAIDARNLSITLFHSSGQIDRVVETVRLRPIALSSVGFTSFSFEQHETYLDLRWGKSGG